MSDLKAQSRARGTRVATGNRNPDLHHARAPGLARRLATMLYDLLLLFGVLVVAAALFYTGFKLITGGDTITGVGRPLV